MQGKTDDFPSLSEFQCQDLSNLHDINSDSATTNATNFINKKESNLLKKYDSSSDLKVNRSTKKSQPSDTNYGMINLINQIKMSNPTIYNSKNIAKNVQSSNFSSSTNTTKKYDPSSLADQTTNSNFNASASHDSTNIDNPCSVSFAPSIELTSLGVNLDQPSQIYMTFSSPFVECANEPVHFDAFVPYEYSMDAAQVDRICRLKIQDLQDDILFFFFYTKANDFMQLVSATSLYGKGWLFNKIDQKWYKSIDGTQFQVFNPHSWQKTVEQISEELERAIVREPPLAFNVIENLWLGPQNQILQKVNHQHHQSQASANTKFASSNSGGGGSNPKASEGGI
ncbi:MAG: CCR4-NOT transcription complex subunit 2 [Marteilia pararefringens]